MKIFLSRDGTDMKAFIEKKQVGTSLPSEPN
jgi:hypothetical protein